MKKAKREKDINSREGAVTKDMQPAEPRLHSFRFTTGGREETVQAKSYQEALSIYKKSLKK